MIYLIQWKRLQNKEALEVSESKVKASTIAKNKYNAKAYDNLRIVVKKGRKSEIQAHAAARGESINGFVNRAIEETMQRDKQDKAE